MAHPRNLKKKITTEITKITNKQKVKTLIVTEDVRQLEFSNIAGRSIKLFQQFKKCCTVNSAHTPKRNEKVYPLQWFGCFLPSTRLELYPRGIIFGCGIFKEISFREGLRSIGKYS